MRTLKSGQAGFSLAELLVAVVILAIGLLGLAELQISAMRTNAKSEGVLATSSLVQEIIEQVIAMDPADAMFDSEVTGQVWPDSPVEIEGAGSFNITYDVETDHQGVTSLCLVRVNVAPVGASSLGLFSTRPVSMTTLKRAL